MLRWIERTREKPKQVRDRYAFIGAFLVTATIASGWLLSLPAHFAAVDEAETQEQQAEPTGRSFSDIFGDIKDNFASVIESARESAATGTGSTTAETGASTAGTSSAGAPTLSDENRARLQRAQASNTAPAPRNILIATTSRAASSTATE